MSEARSILRPSGYEPEDAAGFILQHAKESKCADCRKVYGDEEKYRRLFASCQQCTGTTATVCTPVQM